MNLTADDRAKASRILVGDSWLHIVPGSLSTATGTLASTKQRRAINFDGGELAFMERELKAIYKGLIWT